MPKLKLHLDQLTVDSFDTLAADARRGTVQAFAPPTLLYTCATCDPSCESCNSCFNTCHNTCGPSCNGTCVTCYTACEQESCVYVCP